MIFQEAIDIHLVLPAADYPSAREHVILGTAKPEIDLSAHPGTSKPFVVVFLYHPVFLGKSSALAKPSGLYLRARHFKSSSPCSC
jgi:hypothetical protein